MHHAREPFEFVTVSYLIRIRPERAITLAELAAGLRTCSNASIFHHTFESMERHHYTYFSNDFAQWVRASCNEPWLAERLAAVDVRECVSLDELRESIALPVEDHVRRLPDSANRPGFEPFYFGEAQEVSVSLGTSATTLAELADGISHLSLQTIHHHFINSRVRLHLKTNDFSYWIEKSLDMPKLSEKLNALDIYMNTLDDLRREILATIRPWVNQ